MVKELYSYDLTRQAKALAICIGVVFVYTVIALLLSNRFESLHVLQYFLIFLGLSVSFINLVNLIFQIYLIYDYNKTMYGTQGILTNILPMDTGSVVLAKSLSIMTVMLLINIALSILTLVIFAAFASQVNLDEFEEVAMVFHSLAKFFELGIPAWYIVAAVVGLLVQSFYTAGFVVFVNSIANLPSFKKYKLFVLILTSIIIIVICIMFINFAYQINVGFSQELLFDSRGILNGFGPLKFSHDSSPFIDWNDNEGLPNVLSFAIAPTLIMFISAIILMGAGIYLAARKLRIK